MAQKELLFLMKMFKKTMLILIMQVVTNITYVHANSWNENDKADNSWIFDLVNSSKERVFVSIKEKYIELQQMMSKSNNSEESEESMIQNIFDKQLDLRVFVSSSMSNQLLKSYIDEAKNYKATLIFNGLPNGSWQELYKLISEIIDNDDAVSMQIDDEAFKRFDIKAVPSFILSQSNRDQWQNENDSEIFDKASGNIGIRRFLELVATDGELASQAKELLE